MGGASPFSFFQEYKTLLIMVFYLSNSFCDVTLKCHFICTLDGNVNGIFWQQRFAILIS